MKLPNLTEAVIPQAKVVDYLLSSSHPNGRHKAAFFIRYGFTPVSWQIFSDALIEHAAAHDLSGTEHERWGIRYTVEGTLTTPSGSSPLGPSKESPLIGWRHGPGMFVHRPGHFYVVGE